MKNSRRRQRRRKNGASKILISAVFLVLLVVMSVKQVGLQKKYDEYQKKENTLQTKIETEKDRADDIEEFRKYAKTKKYIEEIARDKLGLVYEDETVFKAN